MAKTKSKKKTLASTRQNLNAKKQVNNPPKKKTKLAKLKATKEKTKAITKKTTQKLKKTAKITTTKAKKTVSKIAKKTTAITAKKTKEKTETIKTSDKQEKQQDNTSKKQKTFKITLKGKKKKIAGIILALIALIAGITASYILFVKMFQAEPLANLVPQTNAVFIAEINIDPSDNQPENFYKLLKNYKVYQSENIKNEVSKLTKINYESDISSWIGRKAGVVVLTTPSQDQPFTYLAFIESRNHDETIQSLNDQTLYEKDGQKIYGIKNIDGNFTFINNYLVYAPTKTAMNIYLDSIKDKQQRLKQEQTYQKIVNNLPQGELAFAYINYNKIIENLQNNEQFKSTKGQELRELKPFLSIFKAEGIKIFAENNKFKAQSYTAIDNSALNGESYLTYNEKYKGELLNLVNPNSILILGGHDLSKEIGRLTDIFKSGTKTSNLVVDGLLEAQVQKYFGKNIELKDDIYKVLKGEYSLTVEKSFEEPVISLLIKLTNGIEDKEKINKLTRAFIETSGIFTPKIQKVELPDGTIGHEIIASPEQIEESIDKYHSSEIHNLIIGDTTIVISYAIINDIVVFSNSENTIKSIIDKKDGTNKESFTNSTIYKNEIQQILATSDEIIRVQLGAITDIFKISDNEYLTPFTGFTITKNYFHDGISTIYLVEVL